MKLVELLARELEEWPEGVVSYFQWGNGAIFATSKSVPTEYCHGMWMLVGSHIEMAYDAPLYGTAHELAADHSTAIITREMWQAERDKLKGEKKVRKANKEGWIRHRGGKCPVEDISLIEVRRRNGKTNILEDNDAENTNETWLHVGDNDDIMAYRHVKIEPADIYAADENTESAPVVEFIKSTVGQIDGPLQWRDRIHEIDAARKEEEARHCAVMEAFDKERAELVAKLAAEGLALAECVEAPAEDMSDWRNWRKGDLVKRASSKSPAVYTSGQLYRVIGLEHQGPAIEDDCGDGSFCIADSEELRSRFRWHSRPTN